MTKLSDLAEINGSKIYYELFGSGPTLVLVHGFALDSRLWDPQIEIFSSKHSVLRYDLRGFGKSDLPGNEPYSHSDDLKELLMFLDITKASLLGLSLGGKVAIDFALSHPDLVDKLIVADTALSGYELVEFNKSIGKIVETAFSSGMDDAKALFGSHELFAPAVAIPGIANHLGMILSDYSGWHFMNENPVKWIEPSARSQLGKLKAQTLIILGELDSGEFHDISDILKNGIVESQREIIPKVGHVSNLENPELFNQIVLNFLKN